MLRSLVSIQEVPRLFHPLFSTECPPRREDSTVQCASLTFQASAAMRLAVYLVVKLSVWGLQGLMDQDVIDSCRSQHSSQ